MKLLWHHLLLSVSEKIRLHSLLLLENKRLSVVAHDGYDHAIEINEDRDEVEKGSSNTFLHVCLEIPSGMQFNCIIDTDVSLRY